MNVALFDYGAGNLHSLAKALERGGARVFLTSDWQEVLCQDALVLPGVGAFGAAAAALAGGREPLREALLDGFPCLGICLGMQLFFDGSEEGEGEGLGVIAGEVRRLETSVVPHMGWNDVHPLGHDPLFSGLPSLVAYFAHSYAALPRDPKVILAETEVEGVRFPAAVRAGRTWGVQFHPEKSSVQGLRLLQNFLEEVR